MNKQKNIKEYSLQSKLYLESTTRFVRTDSGITLIALVITIIVLLILAGISLRLIAGDEGILVRAEKAVNKNNMAIEEEKMKIILNEWQIQKKIQNQTLEEFLNEKVTNGEIDEIEKTEGNIRIVRNNYAIVTDTNGNIVEEIQENILRPKISNISITLDGKNEIEDYSQKHGTPLQINFDASIEGGTIKSIMPQIPYKTNGEENVEFTIIGEVNEKEYSKTLVVSAGKKYREKIMSDVVQIGDYVDYPVEYNNANGSTLTGWRVLSINEDETVNIVSAGTPYIYTAATDNATIVQVLSTNFVNTFGNAMFNENYAASIRTITYNEIINNNSDLKINGSNYYIYYDATGYYKLKDGNISGWTTANHHYAETYGVRPVIKLRENVNVDKDNTDNITHNTKETAWELILKE